MQKRKAVGSGQKRPEPERAAANRARPSGRRGGPRPLIGELALEAGLIPPDMLAQALDRQRQWGDRLGQILVSSGALRFRDLAHLYGVQRGLPVVDLAAEPRDETLAVEDDLDFYLGTTCLPWRRRAGETIYVASDPDSARHAIAAHDGRARPVFVASQHDISRTLTRDFASALTDRAVFDLQRSMPELSLIHI